MVTAVDYYASKIFVGLSPALSHKVYGDLKGTTMKWVPLSSCNDYLVAGGYSLSSVGYKAHVWCAGYTKPYGPCKRPSKIYCVRGPLSQQRLKNHMNISAPCGGDPLLLLPDLYETEGLDIIPCIFTQEELDNSCELIRANARRVTLNDSLETILIAIKNALFVVTDVFEGLVISDAYRVPSSYVINGAIPFVVRDYLGNFDRSKQGIIEKFPSSLGNFWDYRVRNVSILKSNLISTIPSL